MNGRFFVSRSVFVINEPAERQSPTVIQATDSLSVSRGNLKMKAKIVIGTFALLLLVGFFPGTAAAQDSIYSASGDMAVVSKYLWRGQRLTNDWSLQPAVTMGIGGFAFNTWATMDLTAVNPGADGRLPILPGDGLQGKFSEVDYTFSYSQSFESASLNVGTIFYTFPERFASTTEIYGGVSLDTVPLAPSFTLYVDVDETAANDGTAGLYFNIAAGHSIPFNNDVFTGLDLAGSLAFANSGFTEFYYGGLSDGGPHDATFTISLPISIDDNWSAGAFVTYSGLLGEGIRNSQFQDPRVAPKPTGASYADTVWGGLSLSLSF
jgi:hypothetical protein